VGITVLLFLLTGINSLWGAPADAVDWIQDYSKAFSTAKREDKNVLVVVTAPEWCHYCQKLDSETFSQSKVQKLIEDHFVALQVLDKVNGQRNPDLSKFNFSGFPTLFVYNHEEDLLAKAGGFLPPDPFMDWLSGYTDPTLQPEDFFLEFTVLKKIDSSSDVEEGVIFRQSEPGFWKKIEPDLVVSFREIQRDQNYVYLYNEKEQYHYAFPLGGGKVQKSVDKGKNWTPVFEVGAASPPAGD
jgi:thioredoxin-related protein